MDKERLGKFIAELRKEHNMTQKMLADRLCVSDKAVSKWERGQGFPDITLMEPIADIFSISLTELFECSLHTDPSSKDTAATDSLIRESLFLQEIKERTIMNRKRLTRIFIYMLISVLCATEILLLHLLGFPLIDKTGANLMLIIPMAYIFGLYFWIFAREKLPVIYDKEKISVYYDGPFRMNVPGVRFNNSNWPHIIKGLRIWSAAILVAYPVIYPLSLKLEEAYTFLLLPLELVIIFTIFIPVYVGARKADCIKSERNQGS